MTKHHFGSRGTARTEEYGWGGSLVELVVDVVVYTVVEMVKKVVVLGQHFVKKEVMLVW